MFDGTRKGFPLENIGRGAAAQTFNARIERCLRATDTVVVVYLPRLENRVYRKEIAVVADAQCAVTRCWKGAFTMIASNVTAGRPNTCALDIHNQTRGGSFTRAFYTANRIKPIA